MSVEFCFIKHLSDRLLKIPICLHHSSKLELPVYQTVLKYALVLNS